MLSTGNGESLSVFSLKKRVVLEKTRNEYPTSELMPLAFAISTLDGDRI